MNSRCKIDTSFSNNIPDDTQPKISQDDTRPIDNCLSCIESKINDKDCFEKLSNILPEKKQEYLTKMFLIFL